jgi:cryptochrome
LTFSAHNTVHWFRKDLRLHDNPSLLKALKDSKTFYGVYFLDPQLLKGAAKVSSKRVVFLLQCLRNLDNNLKRNGSRLFVIQGRPLEKLQIIFKDWNITRLSFESDPEPHASTRDAAVRKLAANSNIEVISKVSHTLFDVKEVLDANEGEIPMTLDYFEIVAASLKVRAPVNAVCRRVLDGCMTLVDRDHDTKYGVPDSSYSGLKETSKNFCSPFKGGETEALARLDKSILKVR